MLEYLKFDENNVKTVCEMDGFHADMGMNIWVRVLQPGQTLEFCSDTLETAVLLLAGRVKFVCLNTNALEYDFTDPIPDFDFLNTELQADASRYDRTVFCMHAPPLCEQFNNEVLQAFHHYLSLFPGVLFCTAGHLHKNDCFSPLDDGITYYVTDSSNHRNYILFTITPNGYEAENIHY